MTTTGQKDLGAINPVIDEGSNGSLETKRVSGSSVAVPSEISENLTEVEIKRQKNIARLRMYAETAVANKKALLDPQLVDRPNNKAKDPMERKLANALYNYTHSAKSSYDKEFDEQIHRAKPIWFVDTVGDNKRRLLDPSMVNRPKQNSGNLDEKKLACVLSSYIIKSSSSYDAEFDGKIHQEKPHWFESETVPNKRRLLDPSLAVRPKQDAKDPEEKKLGCALNSYTVKCKSSYDPEFDQRIRREKPGWFRDMGMAAKNKKRLLDARMVNRPKNNSSKAEERRLAHSLNSYISKSGRSYDAKFDERIRREKPSWFERRMGSIKSKARLLDPSLVNRPNIKSRDPVERKLGRALYNYTHKTGRSYDQEFDERIRLEKPYWFVKNVSEEKVAA